MICSHTLKGTNKTLYLYYDRALRVFGYEASQKQFAITDAYDISLLLSKKGKLLMQRVHNARAETAALEFFGETICFRRLRRSITITSANYFESALKCFGQDRSIAEDRVDKDLVENS